MSFGDPRIFPGRSNLSAGWSSRVPTSFYWTMTDTIRELERLAKWVRSDPAVRRNDDIQDNIARTIENRIRQLKNQWQLKQLENMKEPW